MEDEAADEAREPEKPAPGASSPAAWSPEGTDLAKALVARAKAAGRAGGAPRSVRRRSSSASKSTRRRRSPGAGWSGPGQDDRDPQALGDALDKLVSEHGWGAEISGHGAVARWEQVVGADIAAHVVPEGFAEGVLSVRADSTAWATQVKLLAPQLVRRLNEEIGDGSVTRVAVLAPQARSWRKGPRSVPGRGPRDTYG